MSTLRYIMWIALHKILVCTASTPDFAAVHAAREAFSSLAHTFDIYDAALRKVAPFYNPDVPPGPPFDMYYHLEILDRLRQNVSSLLDESEGVWDDLLLNRNTTT